MMSLPFYLTDVFGGARYSGNQLATVFDGDGRLSGADMQRIAREINFSETSFITAREPVDGAFPVRIFTPRAEVEFAGHPTLGTAWLIRKHLLLDERVTELALDVKAGRVPVRFSGRHDRHGNELLWMRQIAPVFGEALPMPWCADLLGLSPADLHTDWPALQVSTGFPHLVIPVRTLAALRRARIDLMLYRPWAENAWAKNILVFCPQAYEPGQTLAVRVFADYYGVAEDAATGSGNGCLAAYLTHTGFAGADAIDISVGQGYELDRPSELHLRARREGRAIEVEIGGAVIDVARGAWGGV